MQGSSAAAETAALTPVQLVCAHACADVISANQVIALLERNSAQCIFDACQVVRERRAAGATLEDPARLIKARLLPQIQAANLSPRKRKTIAALLAAYRAAAR